MDVFVLDENFNTVAVIDDYISLIWTERYSEYGDFELYTLATIELLQILKKDRYLAISESDRVMIIDDIKLETDIEDGVFLTVTGKSLESILERRIIWGQRTIKNNLQFSIKALLNENIIRPVDGERRIDNFVFEESNDEVFVDLELGAQFMGDNLYDVIRALCEATGIGFKIVLNAANQFVFSLYAGKDRTYSQNDYPYVVFSPEFDNLLSSDFRDTNKALKNAAFVVGEELEDGSGNRTRSVGDGVGLSRREIFVDAKGVSSKTEDGEVLPDSDYNKLLDQEGQNRLAECIEVSTFTANVDYSRMFKYGEHYFMGDVVQIANEFDIEGTARVTELIRSHSETGLDIYPTFIMIEKEE